MSLFRTLVSLHDPYSVNTAFIIAFRGKLGGLPDGYTNYSDLEVIRITVDFIGDYFKFHLPEHNMFLDKTFFFRMCMKSRPCYIIKDGKLLWSHDDPPAKKIQRTWRRYRLKTTRDRNDLVIKGLAEYFGHPRFQNFSLKEDE
jgi:hypothetical protein